MPNYNLSINSQFKPYSFEDYAKPYAMYKDSYDKMDEAYGKLQTEAEQYRYIANLMNEDDPIRQRYEDFAANLEQQANILATEGMNPSSRRALWDATKRYAMDVLPMKAGYEALAAEMKTQANSPNVAFKHRVSYNDLPAYIADPMGISRDQRTVDLNNVTKIASDMYSALAKEFKGISRYGNLNDWTTVLVEKYGLKEDDVYNFMQNPTENGMVGMIYKTIMDREGIDINDTSWSDIDRIKAAVISGSTAAIGKDEVRYNEDDVKKWQLTTGSKLEEPSEENPTIRTESYLDADTKSNYINLIEGTNIPRTIGSEGAANPMAIYENRKKNREEALASNSNIGKAAFLNLYRNATEEEKKALEPYYNKVKGDEGTPYQQDDFIRNNWGVILDALDRQKYGYSSVLTDDEYQMLSDLGYTSETGLSEFSKENIMKAVDRTSKARTAYSTSLSDYSEVNDIISRQLQNKDNNKQFAGEIYEVTSKGKKGKEVSEYKDLKISKDNPIADVWYMPPSEYNNFGQGKCIIQLANGKKYLMPLSVISESLGRSVASMESTGIEGKENEFKNERERTSAVNYIIRKSLQSIYNPVRTKTSSHE